MKLIKQSSIALIACTILSHSSFGQNQQVNQPNSINIGFPQTSVPAINPNLGSSRPVPAINPNLGSSRPVPAISNLNASYGNTFNQQANTGGGQHSCKSHELNEQHYQDRGILQEFNLSYMSTAQSMANYRERRRKRFFNCEYCILYFRSLLLEFIV